MTLAAVVGALAPASVKATPLTELVGPTPWTAPQSPDLVEPPGTWIGPGLRVGGTLLGIGVDVYDYRMLEPGTAVSFDLRLAWPGVDSRTDPLGVRPYAAIGPTLFVLEPTDAVMPWRVTDPSLAIGVKGALGLNWQVDSASAMFGEYRVTRGLGDRVMPAAPRGGDPSRYDLLYGVRFRF